MPPVRPNNTAEGIAAGCFTLAVLFAMLAFLAATTRDWAWVICGAGVPAAIAAAILAAREAAKPKD
jgi:CDP-diglyceride synthetase